MDERRGTPAALEEVRGLQEAVATIAARLADTDCDDAGAAIEEALGLLACAGRADRAFVFRYSDDLATMNLTHEWCGPGVPARRPFFQDVPTDIVPSVRERFARGKVVHVARRSALGGELGRERKALEQLGICSAVGAPMIRHGSLCGFVGLERTTEERGWDNDGIRSLRAAAGMIAGLFARCDAEEAMRRQQNQFRALVQHSSDTITIIDEHAQVLHSSGQPLLGWPPGSVLGRPASELLHPDDLALALDALGELIGGGAEHAGPIVVRVLSYSGEWVPVEIVANNRLADPDVGGIILNLRDVRDRLRAEEELRQSEDRMRTLIENIPGAVYRCEAAPPWRDVFISDAIEDLTGYAAEEFLRGSVELDQLMLPGHAERTDQELHEAIAQRRPFLCEYPIWHRDGSVRWLSERGQIACEDGEPAWIDGVIVDVTQRHELMTRLAHDAAHDPLTGLVNRARLLDELDGALVRGSRLPSTVAVLFLDLDRFKLVNDALGHAAGDELLTAFARRLRSQLRRSSIAGRTGGDEFVVVCPDVENQDDALAIALRIERSLERPFLIRDREVFVSASIGIAIADPTSTPTELLRDADVAAYRAKEAGRHRIEVFDERLRAQTAAALELESALHRAVDDDRIVLRFQPVVSLDTREPLGFEALARWDHPELGLLGPDRFLDAAETSGLIIPIGRRVLEHACAVLAAGGPLHGTHHTLSVNLSPRELAQPDIATRVARMLEDHGIPPHRLCVELTESALLEDADTARDTLNRLRDAGVCLAIDDFGTGYSSLSYLRRLPVDVVKIDRSFVAEIGSGRGSAGETIVNGVVGLALGLGLRVVAEGIETEAQAERLRALGCQLGQGFLFSRPAELPALLRSQPTAARHS